MRKTVFILMLGMIFYACDNQSDILTDTESGVTADSNFVDKREAFALASMLEFSVENDILSPENTVKSITTHEVDNVFTLGDKEKPTFYIVNYKNNNGYVILAADKRAEPVLAFSTYGNFSSDDSHEIPGGLTEWIESIDEYVTWIRNSNLQIETKAICDALRSTIVDEDVIELKAVSNCYPSNNPPPSCSSSSTVRGPLLSTVWGQGDDYNKFIPLNCFNEKAAVGCNAVAMAQVMKYHRHPNNYDWNAMKNDKATDETARLMLDAGQSIGMKYSCNGSSSESKDIPGALKNKFRYSSAKYGDYNHTTVIAQIDNRLPVILRGENNSTGSRHTWVCDGYKRINSCTSTSLFIHINWGSSENDRNIWVLYNSWTINGANYYNKAAMIYDIKP